MCWMKRAYEPVQVRKHYLVTGYFPGKLEGSAALVVHVLGCPGGAVPPGRANARPGVVAQPEVARVAVVGPVREAGEDGDGVVALRPADPHHVLEAHLGADGPLHARLFPAVAERGGGPPGIAEEQAGRAV